MSLKLTAISKYINLLLFFLLRGEDNFFVSAKTHASLSAEEELNPSDACIQKGDFLSYLKIYLYIYMFFVLFK